MAVVLCKEIITGFVCDEAGAGFPGRALYSTGAVRGSLTPVAAATQDRRSPSEPLYQNNETFGRRQRRGVAAATA
jgi:hypothetical protein